MVNRIFPILLGMTLFHALNPSPGRAAFSPVIQSGSHSKSAPSDASSGQTLPSTKPAGSAPATIDLELLAANNPQNSLRITSLPPVAIQDKQKTTKDYLFEWGAWAFNLLLVIVGALQLLMLRQTRQEMSLQRGVMSLQREEMSRQRELMFLQYRSNVDSTRAKLFAIFPPEKPSFIPSPTVEDSVEINGLAVRIANNGLTDADEVNAVGDVLIGDNKSGTVPDLKRLNIKSRIRGKSSDETVESTDAVLFELAPGGSMTVSQEIEDKLRNKEAHLRMVGRITYTDAYGYARESSFDFLWVHWVPGGRARTVDKSGWIDQSEKELSSRRPEWENVAETSAIKVVR